MKHHHLARVLGLLLLQILLLTGSILPLAGEKQAPRAYADESPSPGLTGRPVSPNKLVEQNQTDPSVTALPWLVETVDATGEAGWHTSLALDAAGLPHISYYDWSNGDLKYAYFDGASWQIEVADSTGNVGQYTSLALDAAGLPHISHYDPLFGDLKHTYHDGTSWQSEVLDSGGDVGEYTSLALDAADQLHISYYNASTGDLKYVGPFGSGTVDSGGNVGQYTSLALDSNDRPHISYYDATMGDLKYAYHDGTSWQIGTADSGTDVGQYTSLALDSSDRPHISYRDASSGDLKYAYHDGTSWQIQTVGDEGQFTSLALDTSDQPYISYYNSNDADLKYAYLSGTVWVSETVDVAGDVGQYTALALAPAGTPHISYYDATNADLKFARACVATVGADIDGPTTLAARELGLYVATQIPLTATLPVTFTWDNGTVSPTAAYSWTMPGVHTVTVTATNFCGEGSGTFTVTVCQVDTPNWHARMLDSVGDWSSGGGNSLALDTGSLPHISYFDADNYDLRYAHHDGTAWQLKTVDSAGSVGWYNSLALDTADRPHISYLDSVLVNANLKYAYLSGTMWISETVDSVGDVGYFSSLALDLNDLPHIAYFDYGNNDLKYAFHDGLSWQVGPVDSGGDVGWFPSLALDASDLPHISYLDATNGDLKYAHYDGASWQIEVVASAIGWDLGGYTSLDLDSSDLPHIAYYDASDGSLEYARYDGAAWQIETVNREGESCKFASLALGTDDQPYISYYDATHGSLKVARDDGCTWQISAADDAGDVGGFSSLALNSFDLPHISYYDYSQDDVKYAFECIAVEGVDVSGPTFLLIGEVGSYTVTYTPITATVPVTFTWDNGSISPTAIYSWTTPGIYTVTVTATNPCAQVVKNLVVEVCQPLEEVQVNGPADLTLGETGIYTASYTPLTVSLPLTFTWDNGTISPTAAYSWTTPGDYAITVTATNPCALATGELTVTVCQPVEEVEIDGPVGLPVGQPGTFIANYTPITASLPLTITWDNGTVGPTAVYSWTEPGTFSLTVTATNDCGQSSDIHFVVVCWAVEGVLLSGPANLQVGEEGIYFASYTPPTATLPITIIWDNGSFGPTAVYSWTVAGFYTITATAVNSCSQASENLVVEVRGAYQIYLPIVMKD